MIIAFDADGKHHVIVADITSFSMQDVQADLALPKLVQFM